MPLLQSIGLLSLLAAVGVTLISGLLWLRTHHVWWGRIGLGTPLVYGILLVGVTAFRGEEILAPGTPLHFCGFYIDCHLSVTVLEVERTPSEWRARLRLANDARQAALAPRGMKVELVRGDSAVLLVPDQRDLETPIAAGGVRDFTVAFAAAREGETPTLRVTEGTGVDRVIEGVLLGDDDALGRRRARLGL